MIGWMILLPGERKPNCPVPVGPWPAILPQDVALQEDVYGIRWNHPPHGQAKVIDGLTFHGYAGDTLKRQACFWSHFHLWRRCVLDDEPTLILESDAVFTRRFDPAEIDAPMLGVISLNDPRGSTRKAGWYHDYLHECRTRHLPFAEVPWVDTDNTIPQGLPGHSAYVLFPWFAREIIEGIQRRGAMPNDAAVCRQWYPGKLGCITNYATKVTGRPSTLA